MIQRIKHTYNEFNTNFWVLMGATLIDKIGNFMLYPFFALYLTDRFGVGMTQAGYLFAIFAVANFMGGFLGGALTDKLGRKKMLIFGLIMSATGNIGLGLVDNLTHFYIIAGITGLLSAASNPAQDAMVADLLPNDKLTEGYGFQRIVHNLAVTVGPMIGGLLASYSYLWLFIGDAITSYIVAVIAYRVLPETKPEKGEDKPEETVLDILKGYRVVLADTLFMTFLGLIIFHNLAYFQMNSTLSVFLRDVHGIPPEGYGYILSLNAGMVVLLQFYFTRLIKGYPPILMMALGCAIYTIGFSMYGFVSGFFMFAVAMVIITIGEMIISPVSQTLVAIFAPEDMRGRYMGINAMRWLIPLGTAPILAGLVMDNFDPNWVWYGAGIILFISTFGFILLNFRARDHLSTAAGTKIAG